MSLDAKPLKISPLVILCTNRLFKRIDGLWRICPGIGINEFGRIFWSFVTY